MGARVRGAHVGQRKDCIVRAGGRLRGVAVEEGGDERALVEHVALGRAAKEALATIAKGRGDHVLLSAVDIAVTGTQNLAPGRPRLLDLGRGPLLLALPPVVVDGSSGLAQDDLLDPVTARPAGRCLALQRDAQRLATIGFDLVVEVYQLFPVVWLY